MVSFDGFLILVAVFLPAIVAPAVILAGAGRRAPLAWMAALPMAASFFALALLTGSPADALEPRTLSLPWIPSLGVELSFLVDGLSLFFGWVICGVGLLVCWYAALYLEGSNRENRRFYATLLLFVTAMLGTVFSDNLLLLFVFWEVTGVASFLLIGFWHEDPEARIGARNALIVTVATGLCLLVGIILLGLSAGTFSLAALTTSGLRHGSWALVLVALGIFGKSALFPFHFWLPGAMAAPTPVSAYLHSATMVKLGVFLTVRMLPIYGDTGLWLMLLGGTGFLTMVLGAFLAFRSNDLKAILAHATISQLGFLIGLYALGAIEGLQADFYHTLSHVFYKASLFMVVGTVQHATGARDIRSLGGLGRLMPLTAAAGLLGAAALAGLPLTTGFISKESALSDLFLFGHSKPALGIAFLSAMLLAAILNTAVAARFFSGIFLGARPTALNFHAPPKALEWPPALLAACVLVFGTFPGLLHPLLGHLAAGSLPEASTDPLALWHGFTPGLFLSAGVLLCGAVVFWRSERARWRRAQIPVWLRFDLWFNRGHDALLVGSRRLTLALQADWPPAYLPILMGFLLIAVGGAALPTLLTMDWGALPFFWGSNPWRSLVVLLIIFSMLGVVFLPRWSAQLIALSISGFFITLFFVLYHAPDLAMTQILVESASVVMILFLLARFPSSSQLGVRFDFGWDARHVLRLVLSVGIGLLMGSLVLFADLHRNADSVGRQFLRLSQPAAAGNNAVNTILVDFRGFDTLGEITVLFVAMLGCLGLMMRYRRAKSADSCARLPGFLLGGKDSP